MTASEGIGKADRDLRLAVAAAAGGDALLWTSLAAADEAAMEAALLARLATRAGVRLDVLVRLNPGVQPVTHQRHGDGLHVQRPDAAAGAGLGWGATHGAAPTRPAGDPPVSGHAAVRLRSVT